MMQKSGDRRLTNRHFLRRQYGLELSQRDIRLLCHQLPDQVLVRRQSIPLVSAEFGRTDTARFAVEPTKADHRADTHTEALRNFRYRGALLRRPHHARTQILRIRLPHPILASFPARILNPIRVRMGIPPDSVFSGNALASRLAHDEPTNTEMVGSRFPHRQQRYAYPDLPESALRGEVQGSAGIGPAKDRGRSR